MNKNTAEIPVPFHTNFVAYMIKAMIVSFFNAIVFILAFFYGESYKTKSNGFLSILKRDLRIAKRACLDLTSKYLEDTETIKKHMLIDTEIFKWKSSKLSLKDIEIVTDQLGYIPHNLIEIGAYSATTTSSIANASSSGSTQDTDDSLRIQLNSTLSIQGHHRRPLVAIVYPLNFNTLNGRYRESDGLKPFPTVCWMTCPELSSRVSVLEHNGWINKLHKRLHTNPAYLAQMVFAHSSYSSFRWSLLTEKDRQFVIDKGWCVHYVRRAKSVLA